MTSGRRLFISAGVRGVREGEMRTEMRQPIVLELWGWWGDGCQWDTGRRGGTEWAGVWRRASIEEGTADRLPKGYAMILDCRSRRRRGQAGVRNDVSSPT